MPVSWSSLGVDLYLRVEPGSKRRAGLESALRSAVRDGRLPSGTLLPSTRGLAHELGLSRGTVTAAYDQLVEEGFLITRPGSGTTVAELPPHLPALAPPALAQPASAPPALAPPDHAPSAGAPPSGPSPVGAPPSPRHDLRPGQPDLSAFPTRAWLAATRRVLAGSPQEIFGAGDPQGRIELRRALADYLGRTRGVLATPERIVVTSGFYQSMGLLAAVLRARDVTTVATEDPGHNHFRAVVQRAGITTAPLPVDAYGARVEELSADVAAAFLTPAHHYPTGVPLHHRRRQAICAWARDTGGLIVEDDYDGEFRYDRQPVGALQGLAPDHTVYCGTASKTLSPALRLAWMVLPPHLVQEVVLAKEEAHQYTESLNQLILADLIATYAFDRHIRAARLRYARRRTLLLDRIATIPRFTVHGVPAGLHTLITAPDHGTTERHLLDHCAAHGIALRGLTELHHDPADSLPGLLIGFAAPSERTYPAALNALTSALTSAGRSALA